MIGRIDLKKDIEERYNRLEKYLGQARDRIINQKYDEALSPLRGACMHVAYVILCDILGLDEATEVASGKVKYNKNSLEKEKGTGKAEGKFLFDQTAIVIEKQLKKELGISNDSKKNNDINDIKSSVGNDLSMYYNDCSTEPHGSSLVLDSKRTTYSIYLGIAGLFDRIHKCKFISSETSELYRKFQDENSLGLLDTKIVKDDVESDAILANERAELNEKLMDIAGAYAKAILVLPSDFAKSVGSQSALLELFQMSWALVIDYHLHETGDFYSQLPEDLKSRFNLIIAPEEKESFQPYNVADGIHRSNWMFAAGDKTSLKTYQKKRTLFASTRFVSDVVKSLYKSNTTSKFIFFILHNDDTNSIIRVVNKFYDDDNWGGDDLDKNFEFLVFNGNNIARYDKYEEVIDQEKHLAPSITNFHLGVLDLLEGITGNKAFSGSVNKRDFNLRVDGNDVSLKEERDKFAEAGLEFIDVNQSNDEEYVFYSGAEITWKELQNGEAIERADFDYQRDRVVRLIKDLKGIQIVTIFCDPGSGATTYARQLVFSIDKKSRESNDFQCTAVVIKRHNRELLIDRLKRLSEMINNTPLLVLAESYILSERALGDAIDSLRDAQKKILFLHVKLKYGSERRGRGEQIQIYLFNPL